MRGRSKRLWLALCVSGVAVGVVAPMAHATGPLNGSKTAQGHWTRTVDWTIEKTVRPSSHELEKGESGTSTYTVTVTKREGADTMYVDGQVCVENVGTVPTENLKIVDRLQAVTGGGVVEIVSQPLDLSVNPVLDPGESQCYPYSLPFEPVAGATLYRNNARITITNDPRAPGEDNGPNALAEFVMPASPTLTGHDVINVDDTNGMSWSFSASGSKTYTEKFTCEDKGTHRNTATIRETGQSDSATVTVSCKRPPKDECKKGDRDWKHKYYGDRCDDDDHHSRCKGGHGWGGFLSWLGRWFH